MTRPTFDTFNEEWARRVVGAKSSRGVDGFLGIVVTEIGPGRLVAEMEVTKDLITIMGTMHGGCLSAMCDHVLGVVMYPVMPPDHWAATTEFKINLLAPVTTGVCPRTARSSPSRSGWPWCASRSRTKGGSSPRPRGPAPSSRPGRDRHGRVAGARPRLRAGSSAVATLGASVRGRGDRHGRAVRRGGPGHRRGGPDGGDRRPRGRGAAWRSSRRPTRSGAPPPGRAARCGSRTTRTWPTSASATAGSKRSPTSCRCRATSSSAA